MPNRRMLSRPKRRSKVLRWWSIALTRFGRLVLRSGVPFGH